MSASNNPSSSWTSPLIKALQKVLGCDGTSAQYRAQIYQQLVTGDSGVPVTYFGMLWSPLWFHYGAMDSFGPFVDMMLNALLADSHASTDMAVTGITNPSSNGSFSNLGRLFQYAIAALNNYSEDLDNRIPEHAVYVALQASFRAVSLKPSEKGSVDVRSAMHDQHEVLALFALIILTLLRRLLETALTKQQLMTLPFHAASLVIRMCVARKFPKIWFIILITLIRDLPSPRPTSAITGPQPGTDTDLRDRTRLASASTFRSIPDNIPNPVRAGQFTEDAKSEGSSDLIEDAIIPTIAGFEWDEVLEIEMDYPAWTTLALAGSIPYSTGNSNSMMPDGDWDRETASLQLRKTVRRLDPWTWQGGLAALQEGKP
jgi:hypothetical protein